MGNSYRNIRMIFVLCLCHICRETGPDICGHISRHSKRSTGPGLALSTKPGARAQLTLISTSAASSTSPGKTDPDHPTCEQLSQMMFLTKYMFLH